MDAMPRIERALERALSFATVGERPPLLCRAVEHAVFAGGARVRPRLCLAVAEACGDPHREASMAAAVSIELLHSASLVHDDLPCFDDSELRRGKPSIHVAFGQPLAVLAGDALIVLAFETLARECAVTPHRLAPLIATVARAVGMPNGIVAGQAWESEPHIDVEEYHRTKTASLFVGATAAGATAADSDPQPWMEVGHQLGAAYQVADDLRDMAASAGEMGKPARRDASNNQPNLVDELGIDGCLARLNDRVASAIDAVPDVPGSDTLRLLIKGEMKRLMPRKLSRSAA